MDRFRFIFKACTILGVNPKGQKAIYKIAISVHFLLFVIGPLVLRVLYFKYVEEEFSEFIITSIKTNVEMWTAVCVWYLSRNVNKYEELWYSLWEDYSNLIAFDVFVAEEFEEKLGDLTREVEQKNDRKILLVNTILLSVYCIVMLHYWLILLKPVEYVHEADLDKMILKDESFFRTYHFMDVTEPIGYWVENFYSAYNISYFVALIWGK